MILAGAVGSGLLQGLNQSENAERKSEICEMVRTAQLAGWVKLPVKSEHPEVTRREYQHTYAPEWRANGGVHLFSHPARENQIGGQQNRAKDHKE
jgi:hypothetical protein